MVAKLLAPIQLNYILIQDLRLIITYLVIIFIYSNFITMADNTTSSNNPPPVSTRVMSDSTGNVQVVQITSELTAEQLA